MTADTPTSKEEETCKTLTDDTAIKTVAPSTETSSEELKKNEKSDETNTADEANSNGASVQEAKGNTEAPKEDKESENKKRKPSDETNGNGDKEQENKEETGKEDESEDKDEANPDTKRRKTEESLNGTNKSTSIFSSFSTAKSTNPFAAALAKANEAATTASKDTKPLFGSSANSGGLFSGSKGFGSSFGSGGTGSIFGSNASSTSIFGSKSGGFGSSSTPFSSGTSGTSILWGAKGSTAAGAATVLSTSSSQSPSKTKSYTPTLFASDPDSVSNGEENEELILQYRAKLFALVPKPSPSTSDKKSEDNKEGSQSDEQVSQEQQKNWREVGIGPLRVLKTKQINPSSPKQSSSSTDDTTSSTTFRIVQRRECTPGGPGTKVILNIIIGGDVPCTISRQTDKYVQLATVSCGEEGKEDTAKKGDSIMYLFKVKTIEEADDLQKKLEECISSNGK